jgi:SAM-dependent methyltransferase
VRRHNILDDSVDALGPGSFDMVCSRLTLFWLADKQESAIRHMVECLRPGGWLVDEDGDWGTLAPVDPSHAYYGCFNHWMIRLESLKTKLDWELAKFFRVGA